MVKKNIGDFNVNCLLYDQVPNIKSFIDMMHSYSAVNLVNKPTWFPVGAQWGRPSVLDHFYTNRVETVQNIGILSNDIAPGHLAVIATISSCANKYKQKISTPILAATKTSIWMILLHL